MSSGADTTRAEAGGLSEDSPVIELRDIFKDYKGLRPLRIAALDVKPRARVAIAGLDRISAEVFLNLLSGAILPDRGDVRIFGQSTTMIRDDVEWMASLDRFGIVTERAMLLDGFSIAQNLVLPMSLDIDPIPDDVATRMRQIAGEVQLPDNLLDRPAVQAAPPIRMRLHLGRALALDPKVLLMEHPTATLPREDVKAFGEAVRTLVQARGITMLALTEDEEFAEIVATERYKLAPGTGALAPVKRRWWPF
jgi:ABC-type lipoprotein export system ATPase subunit